MAGGDGWISAAQVLHENPMGFSQDWIADQAKWPSGSIYTKPDGTTGNYMLPNMSNFIASQQQIAPLQQKISEMAKQLSAAQQPAAPTPAAAPPVAEAPRKSVWNPADFSGGAGAPGGGAPIDRSGGKMRWFLPPGDFRGTLVGKKPNLFPQFAQPGPSNANLPSELNPQPLGV